jgi:hypothetical protein
MRHARRVEIEDMAHHHADHPAGGDAEHPAAGPRGDGQHLGHAGLEVGIAFVALDLGAGPCLHHIADVADELVGRMRFRRAGMGGMGGREVEIVELVQARVDLALGAHVAHALGGFAVAAQAAHQDPVEGVLVGAQPVAQPARLLVAEIGETVIAVLVIGGGIRLTVADQY